jgi:hypothetical protein
MLKVSALSSREGTIYTAEATSSIGPPIAEAGFTLTALTPALTNRSGTVSQTISHVLLGGHTQRAFINMSTAAVWNLPEETWNIVYINPPAATYGNTELAIKAVAGGVESRSGHTAVLNEAGTALIIYGGWVGDLSQAATPQLVILEMESSLTEWRWSIPDQQPTGAGIYGHGAVLLPGNVMMVYGGYATSSSTKRASTQQPMFLNLTSLAWSNEYTNPTLATTTGGSPASSTGSVSGSHSASPSASHGSHPSKLSLGLGLGIGIPLVLLLIALAIWFKRRQRQKRLRRDEVVRGLAQDAGRFLSADDDEMIENEHFGSNWFPASWNGTAAQDWYTGGSDPYVRGSRSLGYETLRGNKASTTYPPAPPFAAASGLNRSRSAARGLYLPTTGVGSGGGYEFGPGGAKAGIHPIYEAEDEDGEAAVVVGRSSSVSPERPPSDESASDPFVTPATTPRGPGPHGGVYFPPPSRSSATPSPEYHFRPHQPQDAEVQEWVSDIDAADAVLTARIGPHGGTTTTTTMMTTTTTTTLTPASLTPPKQTGRPARSRRNSVGFPLEAADEAARTGSNLSESARSNFSFAGGASRSNSVRVAGAAGAADMIVKRNGSSSGSSSHTYNTAKTHGANASAGFTGLREEGPSLLLGSATRGYSPEHHRDDDRDGSPPGSPSKHRPRRSWLGSLKRVFSGSATPDGGSSRADSPEGVGGGSGSDYEPRLVGMGPDGRLLRRKQGREAWAGQGQEDDDEWDVERAVEQRLVQIMFTVPKERLRVVNAEVEREEEGEIVNPEKEGWRDTEEEDFTEGHRYGRVVSERGDDMEKEALRQEMEMEECGGPFEEEKLPLRLDGGDVQNSRGNSEKLALRREESRQGHDNREELLDVPEQERRPSTPLTPVTLHTAEMVRMERPSKTKLLDVKESIESLEKPKTKVLQMVESIESLSRSGSPAGSPVRDK